MKKLDVERNLKAIERDAGHPIPGLRKSLEQANAGKFGRVHTPEQILLREARKSLKMSQPEFAKLISTPVGTLRDWEQGRFPTPGAVKRLSKIAISHPKIVLAS